MRTNHSRALARPRPQLFHIALLGALLIALPGCAALRGAGATPDPTGTPAPTATPQPSPTPRPTPTPAPTIEHPMGATDVVLRMEWGGGFVPMEFFATQMPQFTLYGDGTVVFRPVPGKNALPFGAPNPPFLTGHMSETAMQELLAYALHDGGLADAKASYDFPGIADAGSTNFTINAGGVDKKVSVYALMEGTESGPDQEIRKQMGDLSNRLDGFENEARAGAVDEVSDYDPDAYNVVLFADNGQQPADGVTPREWPWDDVKPSDFETTEGSTWATKVMTRAQVAKLTKVPNGGQLSIWVKAPSGDYVEFALRPLLPDQIAAATAVDTRELYPR